MTDISTNHVVMFGDNIDGIVPTIARISRISAHSTIVQSFLEQVFESVRSVLYGLQQDVRQELGECHTLLDLALWTTTNADTEMAITLPLICAAQLGTYLVDFLLEKEGLIANSRSDAILVGSRVGMLAAAAVACSHSIHNFISISHQVLFVAIEIGAAIDRRAASIAGKSGFYSVSVHRDLDESLPHPMRPFISQESTSSLTISVPGPILESFLAKLRILHHSFKTCQDGMATLHAASLPSLSIEHIVDAFNHDDRDAKSGFRMSTLLSPYSGIPYVANSQHGLFSAVVSDIVNKPALWEKVLHQVQDRIDKNPTLFLPVGSSEMGSFIYHGLRTQGCNISQYPYRQYDDVTSASEQDMAQDIAIVGYSSRLPGSETSDEFWDILASGRDVHGKMPSDRCAGFGFEPPLGCFYENLDLFDCKLFNMSPREAAQTDPGQRLLLMVTYEALQRAGYSPGRTASTHRRCVGTFFGQTTDDWREYNVINDINMFYVPGTIRAFGPGRLNYYFKWDGPSYSFDTACSSSSVAVQMACTSLRSRECDMAVAGGLNTLTGPSMFAGLSQGRFLSTTGSCKTFDLKADGYCRADGVGVLVLKRLDCALRDKDNIYGVIKSAVTNHSARAISITQPHSDTQARLFRKVLSAANLGPSDVSYVEMHGTGTPVGDTAELTSVLSVFGKNRHGGNPLYIGAAKANVGHGEAAAGVTSIIKALLMFQYSKVPPHVGIKAGPNHLIQTLKSANIEVPLSIMDFEKQSSEYSQRRRVMVNNFSAAGGNTCLLLEEGLCQPQSHSKDPRAYHVVAISAQSFAALKSNTERLLAYISTQPRHMPPSAQSTPVVLSDIAYTTTVRRMHHALRRSFVAANMNELSLALKQSLTTWSDPKRKNNQSNIVLLFTGQGSDIMGVGKQLLDTCSAFRASMEECEELAHACGYPPFLALIRNPGEFPMPMPLQVQLATVSLELSMARLLQRWGLKPAVVSGHSLGEYAALCFSGAITTAAMIYLVGYRARLVMETCTTGTHLMLAVRSSVASTEERISSLDLTLTSIACINSPTDVVVAGPDHEIELLETSLKKSYVRCVQLKVPYAFHTAQMDPVMEPFSDAARIVPFTRPSIPVASTLLGRVVTESEEFIPDYFAQQCRLPVRMSAALADAQARGFIDESTIWIECGPHPLCLPMVTSTPSLKASYERCLPCLKRGTDDWRNLANILAVSFEVGIQVDWSEYHHEYSDVLQLAQVPTYAFDLKRYWHSPISTSNTMRLDPSRATSTKKQPSEIFSPVLRSAVLHRVERDEIDSLGVCGRIDFTSELHSDTPLRTMAQGHVVHGNCLVPTSVYTEMILSAAFFRHQRLEGRCLLPTDYVFKVADLVISQPLVVLEDVSGANQHVQISTWSTEESKQVHVEIRSYHGNIAHDKALLHASCRVEITQPAHADHWRISQSNVIGRRDEFTFEAEGGNTSSLRKSSIYRLFRSIVCYHEQYFGMQDITVHNDRPEAIATFQFRKTNDDDLCIYSPYRSDSIAQLAGFLMNALFPASPEKVYISNGWENLYLMEPLLDNVTYLAHAKISEAVSGTISFTVSVINTDAKVVAICQGLRFKEIERNTLMLVLNNAAGGNKWRGVDAPTVSNSLPKVEMVAPPQQRKNGSKPRSRQLVEPERVPDLMQRTLPEPSTVVAVDRNDGETHDERNADTCILDLIMSTIASETGYDKIAWEDNMSFVELGVDSMISMAIIHRVHNKTGHRLPSTIFHEYPTLADLQSYLVTSGRSSQTAGLSSDDRRASSNAGKRETTEDIGARVQLSLQRNTTAQPTVLSDSVEQHSTLSTNGNQKAPQPHVEHRFALVRSVLCSEMGITEEELDEEVSLQELGLDSLLTIGVLSRLRQLLDWELPSTFFLEHTTLGLVRKALTVSVSTNASKDRSRSTREYSAQQSCLPTPTTSYDFVNEPQITEFRQTPGMRHTSLHGISSCGTLLCGKSEEGTRHLFLVPDGIGSGLAYVFVADALKNVYTASEQAKPILYALDSPFLAQPEEFAKRCVSVAELATIYLREVRRIQPHGPYQLGGWSIGGIHAFEMARQLKAVGEKVELLCLIDSPCPSVLSPCPTEVIFEGIGLSVSSVPLPLQQHISANLASLEQYQLPYQDNGPIVEKCLTVWAGRALKQGEVKSSCHGPISPSEKSRNWFFYQRKDFGPCGWDTATGAQMIVRVIQNATHFDIVKEEAAKELAALIANAM